MRNIHSAQHLSSTSYDDAIFAFRSLLHASIIPLILTLFFHNIFLGLLYVGSAAMIYHYFIQEREEYFLFSLGISSTIVCGIFLMGALSAIA